MKKFKITNILISLFFILNIILLCIVFFTPDLAGPGIGFGLGYLSMIINPIQIMYYRLSYSVDFLNKFDSGWIIFISSLLSYVFIGVMIDYFVFKSKKQFQGRFLTSSDIKKTLFYILILACIFIFINFIQNYKQVTFWRCETVNSLQYQKDFCYENYFRTTEDVSACYKIKDPEVIESSGCNKKIFENAKEEVKKNGVETNIRLKEDATQYEISNLLDEIRKRGFTAEYLSKEDSLIKFRERMNSEGQEVPDALTYSPPALIIITSHDMDKQNELIVWLVTNKTGLVEGLYNY